MNYTIRPTEPGDAAGITALRRMPGIFETGGSLPSDREDPTFFSKLGPDQHAFTAALEDGTVAAFIILQTQSSPRRRHAGSLGLMVRPDCQGQGVGAALLAAVLDLADNWLLLHRVELEVFAGSEGAIRLYRRFGFEPEGRKREAMVKDGVYVDLLIMARIRPGSPLLPEDAQPHPKFFEEAL